MSRTSLSICLLTAVALLALPAIGDTPPTGKPPIGSYQKTCKDYKMAGYTLNATCRKMDGSWMNSSLDQAHGCVGDVGNVNGILVCTGPVGSYFRTCRDIKVEGQTMSATCQRRNGSWKQTSLTNFQGFQGTINNCDGNLQNGDC